MTKPKAHEQQRLFIVDEQFVVVQNYKVVRVVDIDKEKLNAELERVVPMQILKKRPTEIFMSVVSELASVPFTKTTMLIEIDDVEPVKLNLHDNALFRHYQKFIQELPASKEMSKRCQRKMEGKKLLKKNCCDEYVDYIRQREKKFR